MLDARFGGLRWTVLVERRRELDQLDGRLLAQAVGADVELTDGAVATEVGDRGWRPRLVKSARKGRMRRYHSSVTVGTRLFCQRPELFPKDTTRPLYAKPQSEHSLTRDT